jgi:hypothetical protein
VRNSIIAPVWGGIRKDISPFMQERSHKVRSSNNSQERKDTMKKIKSTYLLAGVIAILGVFSILVGCSSSSDEDSLGPGPSGGPAAVDLGTSGGFAILAKSGISSISPSVITGDMGVSPNDSTSITGFSLTMDLSGTYSTSAQVTGKVYAADYTAPTPANLTAAVSAMETAFTDAAGRTLPDATELGAGDISGLTIEPGLYKWGTGVLISTDVTLWGSNTATWIFQIGSGLTVSNGAKVILAGGAQAKNIVWQVAGAATLGTTAQVKGIILAQTAITLGTGASMNGRLLAQTAINMDANAITQP